MQRGIVKNMDQMHASSLSHARNHDDFKSIKSESSCDFKLHASVRMQCHKRAVFEEVGFGWVHQTETEAPSARIARAHSSYVEKLR